MALFGFKKKEKKKDEEGRIPAVSDVGAKSDKEEVITSESESKSGTSKTKAAGKSLKKIGETKHRAFFGRQVIENVLVRPRITEKATFAAEQGVYVFEVVPTANKQQIAEAIEHFYKVNPRKINIVCTPAKRIRSRLRGRFGTVAGSKKAYVYLKEGDTLEIV